jgi:hypothetical protein
LLEVLINREHLSYENCNHQPSKEAFYTSMNIVFCEKCHRRIKRPGAWILY